jgi:hypothetical protein
VVRNGKEWMAQLVLLEADLQGGALETCAIENEGQLVLRDVRSAGYKTLLKNGETAVAGVRFDFYSSTPVTTLFPSAKRMAGLVPEEPPEPFLDPLEKWTVPDDPALDDTHALQKAFSSGAATIFLPLGRVYTISDTLRVPPTVRRIVALKDAALRGDVKNFATKPMLRIDGESHQPLTIEHLTVSCWPNPCFGVELASPRPVHLKCVHLANGADLRNTREATGPLFIDEMLFPARFDWPQSVWIRQCNLENNPFRRKKPLPVHITNNGGRVWIFGLATESPAVSVVTLNGGVTEVLGGIFKDSASPREYVHAVAGLPDGVAAPALAPYFITQNASLAATYVQYAPSAGEAREVQAVERRGVREQVLTLEAGNAVIGLYAALNEQAKYAAPPAAPTQKEPAETLAPPMSGNASKGISP